MLAPRPHPHRESPATTPTHAAADKPAEASVIAIPARGSGTLGIPTEFYTVSHVPPNAGTVQTNFAFWWYSQCTQYRLRKN